MHVFLETERMALRRFSMDDVDRVVALDADPLVMRYVSGGAPTPREEVEHDVLPAWLGYYARFAGFGFWAAEDRASGEFLGWFHSGRRPGVRSTRWSWAIDCGGRRGGWAMRRK